MFFILPAVVVIVVGVVVGVVVIVVGVVVIVYCTQFEVPVPSSTVSPGHIQIEVPVPSSTWIQEMSEKIKF